MAEQNRRRKTYQTYGTLAYQTRFDGNTVRAPRPQKVEQPRPQSRPRVQPRRRVRERPHVEVRQQGAIAPFAILGFLSVAICAMFLVMSCAQLAILNDQTVQLKNELEELKSTETVLLAQYELSYDLAAIEQQLTSDGSMTKLQPGQVTYLDVSEPDSLHIYDTTSKGVDGILNQLLALFAQYVS